MLMSKLELNARNPDFVRRGIAQVGEVFVGRVLGTDAALIAILPIALGGTMRFKSHAKVRQWREEQGAYVHSHVAENLPHSVIGFRESRQSFPSRAGWPLLEAQ